MWQAGAEVQVGVREAGGWERALLPLVQPVPQGGPEFKAWVGTVQASVLLLESHAGMELQSLTQPHVTFPTSPGLNRETSSQAGNGQ